MVCVGGNQPGAAPPTKDGRGAAAPRLAPRRVWVGREQRSCPRFWRSRAIQFILVAPSSHHLFIQPVNQPNQPSKTNKRNLQLKSPHALQPAIDAFVCSLHPSSRPTGDRRRFRRNVHQQYHSTTESSPTRRIRSTPFDRGSQRIWLSASSSHWHRPIQCRHRLRVGPRRTRGGRS